MTRRRALCTTAVLSACIAAAAAAVVGSGIITSEQVAAPSAPRQEAKPPLVAPDDAGSYAAAAVTAGELPLIDTTQLIPPYRRDDFGSPWADVDGNSCSQRQDVLARDLDGAVLAEDGCTVLSGTLHDPYTGTTLHFEHDRIAAAGNPGSRGVQADHVVSLSAAFAGGAWAWTDQERLLFANTLDNLLAVDGTTNEQKQDAGPADWLPQAGYVCTYSLKYTGILATWRLAVDGADRDVLVRTLTGCATAASIRP